MSEGIVERIRKLLALANNAGATEAEASTALGMASALMTKYNIEQSSLIRYEGAMLKQIQFPGLDDLWHTWCASTAALLNSCRCAYRDDMYSFIGRKENVEVAAMTATWIVDQVERLYKRDLPKGMSKTARANYRRTFKQACAGRVWHRAQEVIQQMRTDDTVSMKSTGSRALVVASSIDTQLREAADYMQQNMRVRKVKAHNVRGGLGTAAGSRAGNEVQLNRQVSGSRPALTFKGDQ